MIYLLSGPVALIGDGFCVIDANGVGYQAFCSSITLAKLREGEATRLHIYTHVREDHINLYGFADAAERTLFLKLLDVSGVGAKVGMALLSALKPQEIIEAIARGDVTMLTRANGVGKKVAERIILELKSKVGSLPFVAAEGISVVSGGKQSNVAADVMSALGNMGFKQQQAHLAISAAIQQLGTEAAFGDLLKSALNQLRQ